MWRLQIGVHCRRQWFLGCHGDRKTTLSGWWRSQSSYFSGELFRRTSNNSPQQWCTFWHRVRTGRWLLFAMVFLAEDHGLCGVSGLFATGRACCDHVFYLFANTRPPNWLTGSIATFANPLVTCVDFIQRVQTKRWRNDKSLVFHQETSLERNTSSFWPKGLKCWVQFWLVRPSFSAEFL